MVTVTIYGSSILASFHKLALTFKIAGKSYLAKLDVCSYVTIGLAAMTHAEF